MLQKEYIITTTLNEKKMTEKEFETAGQNRSRKNFIAHLIDKINEYPVPDPVTGGDIRTLTTAQKIAFQQLLFALKPNRVALGLNTLLQWASEDIAQLDQDFSEI